ncbi:MAG: glycosyltransferase [Rhodothermales bacterium]
MHSDLSGGPSDVDIVFVVTGDLRYNSRALKQLDLLSQNDCTVLAVGLAEEASLEKLNDNVSIQMLPRPAGQGPRFFRRCHQLFKAFASVQPASVYHASDLYNLPALAKAASQHQAKLVYDARERYPYVASTAKRPWVSWFWEMIESRYIKQADVVFTVSQSIASHIAASYNVEMPAVLHNVPAFRAYEPSDVLRMAFHVPATKKIVLHQGKMQKDRGCLLIARAMQHVEGAVLVFLGDGPLKPIVEAEVERLGLADKIKFKPPVAPAELHAHTCSADIGVTLLEDTCLNHRYALPNKLFEYLMAGLPVLASDLPEIGRIVEEYDVGRVVYPEDPVEIGHVLQQIVDAPARDPESLTKSAKVLETFNWEKASEVFWRKYKNLILTLGN